MIAYLQRITQQRWSWLLLLVSAFFLELCAMVFQHGLGLFPCVMCVYERIATMGLKVGQNLNFAIAAIEISAAGFFDPSRMKNQPASGKP